MGKNVRMTCRTLPHPRLAEQNPQGASRLVCTRSNAYLYIVGEMKTLLLSSTSTFYIFICISTSIGMRGILWSNIYGEQAGIVCRHAMCDCYCFRAAAAIDCSRNSYSASLGQCTHLFFVKNCLISMCPLERTQTTPSPPLSTHF